MIQTLDVQVQNSSPKEAGLKKAGIDSGNALSLNEKPGAETARNGSSFLAMIEKMIAGSMEGTETVEITDLVKKAVRGAGDKTPVPGEADTTKKDGTLLLSFAASSENETFGTKKVELGVGKKDLTQFDLRNRKSQAIDSLVQEEGKSSFGITEAMQEGLSEKESLLKEKKKSDVDTERSVELAFVRKESSVESNTVSLFNVSAHGKAKSSLGDEESEKTEDLGEIKSARKETKVSIGVKDERTDSMVKTPSLFEKSIQINEDNSADIRIGFRATGGGNESSGTASFIGENKGAQGSNFASMLSQEIQSSAADFVKTGQIVLRDNNSGIIRLNLHPESLGNVQIKLELHDKRITGRIVVNSKEAWEAFNENMDGLSDAFIEGGFESGGFDLSWSGNEGAGHNSKEAAAAITPFYASSIPDVMSATETADIHDIGYRSQLRSAINVFA